MYYLGKYISNESIFKPCSFRTTIVKITGQFRAIPDVERHRLELNKLEISMIRLTDNSI